MGRLVEGLAADDHVSPLRDLLKDVQHRASRLLAEQPVAPPVRPEPPREPWPVPPPEPEPGEVVLFEGARAALGRDEALALLDDLRDRLGAAPDSRLRVTYRLTRDAGQ